MIYFDDYGFTFRKYLIQSLNDLLINEKEVLEILNSVVVMA